MFSRGLIAQKAEKLLTYGRLWCIIKKMFVFGRSLLAPTSPREQHTEHAEDDVIRTEWVVMLRTATEVPHTAVAAPCALSCHNLTLPSPPIAIGRACFCRAPIDRPTVSSSRPYVSRRSCIFDMRENERKNGNELHERNQAKQEKAHAGEPV